MKVTTTLIAATAALLLAQTSQQKSFKVNIADLKWTAAELPGVPKGIEQKVLHDNKDNKLVSSIVRFPKGFTEPAHYHKTCGHSIYILKGRIKSPVGELKPGTFTYAAVGEVHGPFTAVEETEFLFYTDGPFDYHLASTKGTK